MSLRDLLIKEFNKVLIPMGFLINIETLNHFCTRISYSLNNTVVEINVDERENYFYYEINKTNINGWEKIASPNRLNQNNILNFADEEAKNRYLIDSKEYLTRKWYRLKKELLLEKYVSANSILMSTVLPKIL